MKKISICLLGIAIYACYACSCILYAHRKTAQDLKPINKEYYILLNSLAFDEHGHPYISVTAENQTILSLLDLGFQGSYAFADKVLDRISHKQFLYTMIYYGALGSAHQGNVYQLSKVQLEAHDMVKPEVFEASEDFFTAGSLLPKSKEIRKIKYSGYIGWKAFTDANFFLDTANSMAGIVDSLATLQKYGYEKYHFIKTPLLLDHGNIEIEVECENGPLRCVLDTGCTFNVMHIESKEGLTHEQIIRAHLVRNIDLKIGGEPFDPITFIHFPILLNPPQVQAILGMDFFKRHIVFIDFVEKYVYLAKKIDPDQL